MSKDNKHLEGPTGQGMTEGYKKSLEKDAKELVKLLDLNFKPLELREKFNNTENKNKNTPK